MHFLKEGQKIRALVDPPPLIQAMPERKRFFELRPSLRWGPTLTVSLTLNYPFFMDDYPYLEGQKLIKPIYSKEDCKRPMCSCHLCYKTALFDATLFRIVYKCFGWLSRSPNCFFQRQISVFFDSTPKICIIWKPLSYIYEFATFFWRWACPPPSPFEQFSNKLQNWYCAAPLINFSETKPGSPDWT